VALLLCRLDSVSGQVSELCPGNNRTGVAAQSKDDESNDNGHWLPLSRFERGYCQGLSSSLGKLVSEALNKLVNVESLDVLFQKAATNTIGGATAFAVFF
jgi:hypothetical protein